MPKPLILERRILNEAILVNPGVAEEMAKAFAKNVKPVQGKDFITLRVRQALIKQDLMHAPIGYDEVEAISTANGQKVAPYIQMAMNTNQQIFKIDITTEAYRNLETTINHLIEWINTMHRVATRTVNPQDQVQVEDTRLTVKAIENLRHQTIEQAMLASEKWYARMGSRSKSTKGEGFTLVKRWPNGYYAVQFDRTAEGKAAMQTDGKDLQNCLQYAHNDSLMKGKLSYFAIRKPNDEAVVGISIQPTGTVVECKGKNNQAVTAAYAGYVADFLTTIKANGINADIRGADIEYENGRYFVFQDSAKQILDQPNIKVWLADSRVLVVSDSSSIKFAIRNGKLEVIKWAWSERSRDRLIIAMNAIGIPPSAAQARESAAAALGNYDVFFNNGQYGGFEQVADTIFDNGQTKALKTENELRIFAPDSKIGFSLEGGRIDSVSADDDFDNDEFNTEDLSNILTNLKIAPTGDGLEMLFDKFEIDYKDGAYGSYDKVSKVIYDRNGIKAWGTASRIKLQKTVEGGEPIDVEVRVRDKSISNIDTDGWDMSADDLVQILNVVKYPPDKWESQGDMGAALFFHGICYTGAKYATIIDAAEKLFENSSVALYNATTVCKSGTKTLPIVVEKDRPYIPAGYSGSRIIENRLNYIILMAYRSSFERFGRKLSVHMLNLIDNASQNASDMKDWGILYDGSTYSLLEAGKPIVFQKGDVELYAITKSSWLAVSNKEPIVHLKLRNGHLKTETTGSDMSKNPGFASAVQWIVSNRGATSYDGVPGSGLIPVAGKMAGTFDYLLEKLSTMEDAAYMPFLKSSGDPRYGGIKNNIHQVESFFEGIGSLNPKQQAQLYRALKPKAPYFQTKVTDQKKIYGVDFDEVTISLPAMYYLIPMNIFSHEAVAERVIADTYTAVERAMAYMEKNKDKAVFTIHVGATWKPPANYPNAEKIIELAYNIKKDMQRKYIQAREDEDQRILDKGLTIKDFSKEEIEGRYRSLIQNEMTKMDVTGVPK